MVGNTDYFIVFGWMVNELNLSGNELNVYSIIHSYCKNGNETKFTRKYLSDFSGASIKTIDRTLENLIKKGYIFKRTEIVNDNINCYFSMNFEYIPESKCPRGVVKMTSATDKMTNINNNLNKSNNNLNNNNCVVTATNNIGTKKSINLRDYLLQDFSKVTRAMLDVYVDQENQKVSIKTKTDSMLDFLKSKFQLIDRQCNFYNIQFGTNYSVELKKIVEVF